MSKKIIVWHYHDLRVEDNPALKEASEKGTVIPLFIQSPEEEQNWKSGAASNWFLHHSLKSLQEAYRRLGTELVIRSGNTERILQDLCAAFSIEGVYWNHRYEPPLLKRDQTIAQKLCGKGIDVRCFEGNYLITPSKLLNQSGGPYSVYTPFSKSAFSLKNWRSPLPAPLLKESHSISSDSLESLTLLPSLDWADSFPDYWSPGRKGALRALEEFKEKIEGYSKKRDFPGLPCTSKLSPHLHFGELSPHEVWKAADEASENAFPFLRQLLWREFGNYFLFHHPQSIDFSWREKFEAFPWETNDEALKAWQKGQTGYPIVDAGMRELWQTGWMHNRVRMIVGSFLIKDLFIHWREGAKWFWDTLVDADLANNTLGWQWVAGCGPDAAPYFRIFNPVLQSKKFDSEGEYIRKWVPELSSLSSKWIHAPWEAPHKPSEYPDPIVDHGEARKKALEGYQKIK